MKADIHAVIIKMKPFRTITEIAHSKTTNNFIDIPQRITMPMLQYSNS